SCVEGRSVTITDEFRIASGYGSVWIVATGADLRFAATAYSGLRGHTESSERFLPLHISLCIHHNSCCNFRIFFPFPKSQIL
ncbi:hypothetical protein D9H82_24310, partial [Escherichia coli]|nr:hypothetical protein [Escherichia coli]